MSVYKAINAVQKGLSKTGISKDRTNQQGAGYKFRGIDDVYNALAPLLAEHGLCILPRMLERACEERQSKAGGALFYVTVKAEFDFVCAEDGSKHTVATFGEAMDSSDKATNKAMSAAYKYACLQAFAIPTEADNDADAHTPQSTSIGASASDLSNASFQNLQPEVQDSLRAMVPRIIVQATHKSLEGISRLWDEAYDNWPEHDSSEIKKALWYLLDSKTRSAISSMEKK